MNYFVNTKHMKALTIGALFAGTMMLSLMVSGAESAFGEKYIKLGDIKGEDTDKSHGPWIDVLSVKNGGYDPFGWIYLFGSFFSTDGIGTSP